MERQRRIDLRQWLIYSADSVQRNHRHGDGDQHGVFKRIRILDDFSDAEGTHGHRNGLPNESHRRFRRYSAVDRYSEWNQQYTSAMERQRRNDLRQWLIYGANRIQRNHRHGNGDQHGGPKRIRIFDDFGDAEGANCHRNGLPNKRHRRFRRHSAVDRYSEWN